MQTLPKAMKLAVLGVISHGCRQLSFGHHQDDLLLELQHVADDARLVRRVLEVGLGGQAMGLEKVGTVKKVSDGQEVGSVG